jgi:hypothetical protein
VSEEFGGREGSAVTDLVREWFQRKLANGVSPLRGMMTVDHEYNRVVGPRSIYAKVSLSISPNDVFAFESMARWPDENYDRFVLDGILDALFGWDYKPPVAARFVLQEVGWHPVNSAPIAYYRAAKIIVRSMLVGSDEGQA